MTPNDESLDRIKLDIRDAGLRATLARIATLQLLRAASSPMTHAVVAEHLASSGVDKATIFRNLSDMTEAGLLRRTELGDHVWRFEAIDAQSPHDASHPHFLCTDCGAVSCLDDVQILLRGRCNDCR